MSRSTQPASMLVAHGRILAATTRRTMPGMVHFYPLRVALISSMVENNGKKSPSRIDAMKTSAREGYQQIKFGFSKLGKDTRGTLELLYRSFQGTKITSRRDIRLIDQTKRDWGKIVPFTMYSMLPLSFVLLPVVLRLVPGFLPSGFMGKDIIEKQDKALAVKRTTLNPIIVKDLWQLLEKISAQSNATTTSELKKTTALIDARNAHYYKRVLRDLLTATPDKRQYSQLAQLLPVFETQLHVGHLTYAQAKQYANFVGIPFSFFLPRTRLLRYVTGILKDDGLIQREGLQSLLTAGPDEVQQAVRERALNVSLKDNGLKEAEKLIREHIRFTQHFGQTSKPISVGPSQSTTPLGCGDYTRQALALIAARALDIKRY